MLTNLSSFLDRFSSLITKFEHQEKNKSDSQIEAQANNIDNEDKLEAIQSKDEEIDKSKTSLCLHLSDHTADEGVHPFAPTDHFSPPPASVYNNHDSSNPNWLPGLPRPPPGVFVKPPRDRSRRERMRYLSQLERLLNKIIFLFY